MALVNVLDWCRLGDPFPPYVFDKWMERNYRGNPERKTLSPKRPWRLAHTLATQTGMTNQWLKDQGLVSVKELWVNIH